MSKDKWRNKMFQRGGISKIQGIAFKPHPLKPSTLKSWERMQRNWIWNQRLEIFHY